MGASWSDPGGASEREVALLEAVVGAASAAVANAQLISELCAARATLEAGNRAKDESLSAVRNSVVAAAHDPAQGARALEMPGASPTSSAA